MTSKVAAALLCCLPVSALSAWTASLMEPDARNDPLGQAIRQADIRTSEMGGFQLRAKYRLLSQPKFEATYLLNWTPRGYWREQVLGAGLGEIRIGTPDGFVWHDSTADGRAAEVFRAMRILDSESDAWPKRGMPLERIPGRAKDGLMMTCLRAHNDKVRVICFHPTTGALLWESFSDSITREYDEYIPWGSKNFPKRYRSYQAKALVAEIEVEELASQQDVAPTLFEKQADMKASRWCRKIQLPRELRTKLPATPSLAVTSGHEYLTIEAIVDTDGRLGKPVFRSSSALVTSYGSAITEEWRFEPASCDGRPIESGIRIEVAITCRPPSTGPHLDCESRANWVYQPQHQ